MPTTTLSNTLTASAKSANVLAGDINEFVNYPALIQIYSVASAISAGSPRITVLADSDVIVDDKSVPFAGATILEDHLIDEFEVDANTRLLITFRESAAATPTMLTKVKITPL